MASVSRPAARGERLAIRPRTLWCRTALSAVVSPTAQSVAHSAAGGELVAHRSFQRRRHRQQRVTQTVDSAGDIGSEVDVTAVEYLQAGQEFVVEVDPAPSDRRDVWRNQRARQRPWDPS